MAAVRSLLCLAHGMFTTGKSLSLTHSLLVKINVSHCPIVTAPPLRFTTHITTGIEETEMAALARENVFLLLEMGVYEATLELLGVEMERGRGVYEGTKTNITIADNLNLRGVLL